ncbi:MAG: hypothetical protein R3247_06680 [Rhodothermales bacterium]|nr:hypothetical protein [Rhodothermales bacterium]
MYELFELLGRVQEIDAATLTVREQARLANNLPELRWSIFFPRQNSDSIRIAEMRTLDLRPVADRRPWGGRGRYIPLEQGKLVELEMAPIEAYFTYDEYLMQRLMERNAQRIDLALDALRVKIPQRAEVLADADYRRVEVDAFWAWRTGEIVAKDPESEQTLTVNLGFDAARYVTPAQAWTNSTAWAELLQHAYEARNMFGAAPRGALVRQSTLTAIGESAPASGITGFKRSRAELEDRIAQELGSEFTFRVEERTVDVFTGKGNATVATKVWPGTEVAFIPPQVSVGSTFFAPVYRAQMMAQGGQNGVPGGLPRDFIDVRGVTLFYLRNEDGKSMTLEAQLNALPIPDERRVYIVDGQI